MEFNYTRNVGLHMWAGHLTDVQRLIKMVDDHLKPYRDGIVINDDLGHLDMRRLEQERDRYQVLVEVTQPESSGSGVGRGPATDLLGGDIDPGTVASLTIGNLDAYMERPRVQVLLGATGIGGRPIAIKVEAHDRVFAEGLAATLETELRSRRPWWWFVRTPAAVVFPMLATFVGLYLAFGPIKSVTGWWGWWDIGFFTVVAGLAWHLLSPPLLERWFPAFELLKDGEKPRGGKAFAVLYGGVTLLLAFGSYFA